jgi:hypothetical protein
MGYELRINGGTAAVYDDPKDALERVRRLLKSGFDIEPEVLDRRTGRPFGPAASMDWREELATKIGF